MKRTSKPAIGHERLESLLSSLPDSPGVYLMKGHDGRVLYVGKASSLRKRVRSYFRASSDDRPFVAELGEMLGDIEYVVTPTEKDALILERRLVQRHKPEFNVDLVDDKNFLSIFVGTGVFPRLQLLRRRPRPADQRERGRWFGPYTSARQARDLFRLVQQAFGLRSCPDRQLKGRNRPCLLYQMGHCSAPCAGLVDADSYERQVRRAVEFLRGRRSEVIESLERRMRQAAAELNFEAAARLRDRIRTISQALEQQPIVEAGRGDADVVSLAGAGRQGVVVLLQVRDGCLVGVVRLGYTGAGGDRADKLRQLLVQHYSTGAEIPGRVVLDRQVTGAEPEDAAALGGYLSELAGAQVDVSSPSRGPYLPLVKLARRNADEELAKRLALERARKQELERLGSRLGLDGPARHIECIDLSTTGGKHSTGAVVVMIDGNLRPDLYRHYRIKQAAKDDDVGMMREVVRRRLERVKAGELPEPDLLLLDGGKGHLNAVAALVEEMGLSISLAAISKGRHKRRSGMRVADEIHLTGRKNPIVVKGSRELLLLSRLRDEAHRFAIGYHRTLRDGRKAWSVLEEIKGVGPVIRSRLLEEFGSLEELARADEKRIAGVKGVTPSMATRIKKALAELPAVAEPAGD